MALEQPHTMTVDKKKELSALLTRDGKRVPFYKQDFASPKITEIAAEILREWCPADLADSGASKQKIANLARQGNATYQGRMLFSWR